MYDAHKVIYVRTLVQKKGFSSWYPLLLLSILIFISGFMNLFSVTFSQPHMPDPSYSVLHRFQRASV